ncbi:hypothetical protein BT96DRAFT_996392 [Gymnopus androsaceus JB14]|uniref:Uncharacterized protein n=1 Tax=Gymnopus androsaceus JB14 TaxID=1447944 RepID=A0A6A4HG29_9AGAR|nr:hypothetical protein BT96DRAFT_996392 [Gymnopus androsaceus JB14]
MHSVSRFLLPDSSTTSWFLTPDERVLAVQRIKLEYEINTSRKNSLHSPPRPQEMDARLILWHLQRCKLAIGAKPFDQRLLQVDEPADVIADRVNICAGISNGRAYIGAIYIIPNIVGLFMVKFVNGTIRLRVVFGRLGTTSFGETVSPSVDIHRSAYNILSYAGTTKKDTVNAIMLCAYCIRNAAGHFMWKQKYKTKTTSLGPLSGPATSSASPCYCSCDYAYLMKIEGADAEPHDDSIDDDVYVERETAEGKIQRVKVDKVCFEFISCVVLYGHE